MKGLKPILALVLVFGLFLVFQPSFKHPFRTLPFEQQKIQAAQSIIKIFEKNGDKLSAGKKGHFQVRLYRLSGDEKYIPGIRIYAERLASRLKTHAQNLNSPEYIQKTAGHFLRLPEEPLVKHRYRLKTRSRWPEMAFAHRLLFLAFQMKSFGLIETAPLRGEGRGEGILQADFDEVMEYLRGLPYRDYVLDDAMIRYNSTRMVNMVYQLKFLGLGDYEKPFTEKFKNVFFAQPDPASDRTVYLNKIYGLTHFIIAASDFYQHPVSKKNFRWILDYFSENRKIILIRNTPDTAAEVAVCFKLAGFEKHPAVESIQKYLLEKFDPKRGMLPSERKDAALDAIEHRNILSVMALTDWQKIYAGPNFGMMDP